MKRLIKRFFLFLLRKRSPLAAGDYAEERWTADFRRAGASGFNLHDSSREAAGKEIGERDASQESRVENGALVLAVKKASCLAWCEAPDRRYRDQMIQARLRLDAKGGYAAAGLMFRMIEEGACYLLLVSSKGYFRLDAVRNNTPQPLAGWTELPPGGTASDIAGGVTVGIIAWGSRILIHIDGRRAASFTDTSLISGSVALAAACYESPVVPLSGLPAAEAYLESLIVDSRADVIAETWDAWEAAAEQVPAADRARAHINLAETFAALDQGAAALAEIRQAWTLRKPEAKELLLAGRLALAAGDAAEAETYADQCIALDGSGEAGRAAGVEKAKLLYEAGRYAELKTFCKKTIDSGDEDPILLTLLGHAHWQSGDNAAARAEAAAAYDRAFELDGENGLLAKNAANVYEVMGDRAAALSRYIAAGNRFLTAGSYEDLGAIVPKLLSLGEADWEARLLVGKWAFGIEQFVQAGDEFRRADELRTALNPVPPPDPSALLLQALLYIREGKRAAALPLLEEAAALASDYGIYHYKLAECRFMLYGDAADPRLKQELDTALALLGAENEKRAAGQGPDESWGWANNLAAQAALQNGDMDEAAARLETAAAVLGEVPALRVNRGVYCYLSGDLQKALEILDENRLGDPDGMLANCGGNLLVKAGRFAEADGWYRKALSIAPDSAEYLCNRAECLIKLDRIGEADELLARAHRIDPSPFVLEQISYVALRKGEFRRAETAAKEALAIDPDHAPSMLALGWLYCSENRWGDAAAVIAKLKEADEKGALNAGARERLAALCEKYEEGAARVINCARCERHWRVPLDPPAAPSLRLYAMPPDDLPAGACPDCGKHYCIGCAKEHLDKNGRFVCPDCSKVLRLINEGLKQLLADWARKNALR